jgi:hypothetical protein
LLRVASVPASHLYIRHLAHPDGPDPVVRLPDPIPADGRKVPGGWWPPLMLQPTWIAQNHQHFDVFHVHFGFDAIGPRVLSDVLHEVSLRDKPLVYTVHDLRNPHHREPEAHEQQQNLLVSAAAEVLTLTPGAAQTIHDRWGRAATVVQHPHVLCPARIVAPKPAVAGFVVGVHVKSLRANMDPFPVLDTLVRTVADLPGAILQIDVHDEIFDPDNHWYAPDAGAALMEYRSHDSVDVRVHPYFTDDELWDYLSRLTVSVLPYRFGTHSGWLEACFDLGTAVVAPSCGFYDQQQPCEIFDFSEERFDPDSLDRAVRAVYARTADGTTSPRATWKDRRAERARLALTHRAVYERVLR